jgi:hypothetical protein
MVSRRARHPGGRHNRGIKLLGFEVALPEELDQVEKRLAERHASVRRLQRDSYETVIGADQTTMRSQSPRVRRGARRKWRNGRTLTRSSKPWLSDGVSPFRPTAAGPRSERA